MSKISAVLSIAVSLILIMIATFSLVPAARAANANDVTVPIHQFIDGFNTGDTKSAYAAYASGNITIVDEFPPHLWTGPHAAQDWAAAFDKESQSKGQSDGNVKYGAPTRTEVKDDVAYVVVPTVFNFKQHGSPMTERGEMTFVLHAESGAWKIAAWTWTGTAAHPVNLQRPQGAPHQGDSH